MPARSRHRPATSRLYATFAATGTLLIFDEVITGFRVGPRGAQGKFGVTPDLSIFAKAVAAGFPLAMVGRRRDVMDPSTRA